METEGVNFVACPRCTMAVMFVQGEGRPPAACPHCGRGLEGFRQVSCDACRGTWETAAPAGAAIACPHCGAQSRAPSSPGETASVRRNIPARIREGATAAPGEPSELDRERARRRRLAALAWAATPVAGLAAAGLAFAASSDLRLGGVAAAAGAVAWAIAVWRAGK